MSSDLSSKEEDFQKVEEALAGDPESYEFLFNKYRNKIYRVVYGYVYNQDDALDITQDAFLKAFQSLHTFRRKAGFYTWLCQIAINKAIDFKRKKKRRQTSQLQEFVSSEDSAIGPSVTPPDRPVEAEELQQGFVEALDQLSEKHRTVFLLNTVENLSYKEIAEALGISIGTVMSRLHYARKRLQKLLKEYLS